MSVSSAPAPTTARRRSTAQARERDGGLAFWLIVPSIVILTLVIGYPVASSLVRSLFGDGIVRTIVQATYSLDDVRSAHAALDAGGHLGKMLLTTE